MPAADPPPGFRLVGGSSEFGHLVGPFYEKVEDGRLYRGFRIEAKHTNRLGIVHGGMLLTFADTLLAAGMRHGLGDPPPAVTIKLSTDLVMAAPLGAWVEGTAEVTRAVDNLVFVRGRAWTHRRTVFTAEGIFQLLPARRRVD